MGMTPKKAALVLMDNWINHCKQRPHFMDAEDMSDVLKPMGFNVTEKRREAILNQCDKMLHKLEVYLADKIANFEG